MTPVKFKITGGFITNLVRDFWIEGKPLKSIAFLVECLPGITESQAINVCTGQQKLVGVNELRLKTDNKKTHGKNNRHLLSVAEMLAKKESIFRKEKRANEDLIRTVNLLETNKRTNYSIKNEEKIEVPKHDPECNALNAWISPDGKFFPCHNSYTHEETASLLSSSGLELEQQGWIKITNNPMIKDYNVLFRCETKITQAQIDTVFIWCQKHGKKMPENLLNNES